MRIEIRYVTLFSYAPVFFLVPQNMAVFYILCTSGWDFQDPCDRSSPFFAVHCWEAVSGFLVLGRDSKISTKSYVGICRAGQSKGEGGHGRVINFWKRARIRIESFKRPSADSSYPRIASSPSKLFASYRISGSHSRTASLSFPAQFSIITAGRLMSRPRRRRRPKLPGSRGSSTRSSNLIFCI